MKIQPLIPLFSSIGIVWGASLTFARTIPHCTRIPIADRPIVTQVLRMNNNFLITDNDDY
jgi:hypothetical protein